MTPKQNTDSTLKAGDGANLRGRLAELTPRLSSIGLNSSPSMAPWAYAVQRALLVVGRVPVALPRRADTVRKPAGGLSGCSWPAALMRPGLL